MSTPVLILGESGSGKSRSMHKLDPSKVLLVQATKKALPWKGAMKEGGWKRYEEGKGGNIFVSDNADNVIALMKGTKKKIIIIDDYQYILSNELLRRWKDKGYDKFSEVGYNGLNMIHVAQGLPDDVRVYFLAHTMVDDVGTVKIKTPGKLMETYTVEGLFSLVLRCIMRDGQYYMATVNSGSDTVKSPEGMFEEELIPNDLALVDQAIKDYGWVQEEVGSAVVPVAKGK